MGAVFFDRAMGLVHYPNNALILLCVNILGAFVLQSPLYFHRRTVTMDDWSFFVVVGGM